MVKKVKPLTKKIINNLIIKKSVVSIFGDYDLERVLLYHKMKIFYILIFQKIIFLAIRNNLFKIH